MNASLIEDARSCALTIRQYIRRKATTRYSISANRIQLAFQRTRSGPRLTLTVRRAAELEAREWDELQRAVLQTLGVDVRRPWTADPEAGATACLIHAHELSAA